MAMVKMMIHIPKPLKSKLEALRATGTTASGLIRHLLEQHFSEAPSRSSKGR